MFVAVIAVIAVINFAWSKIERSKNGLKGKLHGSNL